MAIHFVAAIFQTFFHSVVFFCWKVSRSIVISACPKHCSYKRARMTSPEGYVKANIAYLDIRIRVLKWKGFFRVRTSADGPSILRVDLP